MPIAKRQTPVGQHRTTNTQHLTPAGYEVIVLAAGMSRRMGRTKALLPLAGRPIICTVVETCLACDCVSQVIVVTGHESSSVKEVLATFAVKIVHNPDYETGEMLSSVQTGGRALPAECDAFFLMPGDQPLVQPSTFAALAERFRAAEAPVVLPTYQGKRGHPVLISAQLRTEILALGAGDTLKTALVRHREGSVEIPVTDSGVVLDIDTPEDYEVVVRTINERSVSSQSTIEP